MKGVNGAKCASVYYGSTIRTLYTRVSEHKGLSDRTVKPVAEPKHSSIQYHVMARTILWIILRF